MTYDAEREAWVADDDEVAPEVEECHSDDCPTCTDRGCLRWQGYEAPEDES